MMTNLSKCSQSFQTIIYLLYTCLLHCHFLHLLIVIVNAGNHSKVPIDREDYRSNRTCQYNYYQRLFHFLSFWRLLRLNVHLPSNLQIYHLRVMWEMHPNCSQQAYRLCFLFCRIRLICPLFKNLFEQMRKYLSIVYYFDCSGQKVSVN